MENKGILVFSKIEERGQFTRRTLNPTIKGGPSTVDLPRVKTQKFIIFGANSEFIFAIKDPQIIQEKYRTYPKRSTN